MSPCNGMRVVFVMILTVGPQTPVLSFVVSLSETRAPVLGGTRYPDCRHVFCYCRPDPPLLMSFET